MFLHILAHNLNELEELLHQAAIGEELAAGRMGVADGEAVALVVTVRLHLDRGERYGATAMH